MKDVSRALAFDILMKIYKDDAFTNLALDAALENSSLESRDKGFVTAIVYGTVERTITIDYILSLVLNEPIKSLKLKVLIILRMAVFQLYFMDKVPQSAAVNEAVNLTKSKGCAFASSLVNAVLRKVDENRIDIDEIDEPSIRFSCPQSLINMWLKMYGRENTMGILKSINDSVPICLRVNTLKTDAKSLKQSLADCGVSTADTYLENAVEIMNSSSVTALGDFKNGNFHVQDIASQLCTAALAPKEGDTVYDMCAAPGGKSFTMAQMMNNKGLIKAFDIYENRLSLIEEGARRLGISCIQTQHNDASVFNDSLLLADKVLCDVVCSGLGIIRKKPEIRYKNLDDIKALPETQLKILKTSSRYVRPGGTLVYSTCALNKKENEKVVNAFLESNSEFKAVNCLDDIPRWDKSEYLTLFPHINKSDGFFIAKLERKK